MTRKKKPDETVKIRETKILIKRSARIGPVVVLEEDEERVLEIHEFVTTPAIIKSSAKASMCIPQGRNSHYVSAELEVMLPCYVEELNKDLREQLTRATRLAVQTEAHDLAQFAEEFAKERASKRRKNGQ